MSFVIKGVVSTKNGVVRGISNLQEDDIKKIGHVTQQVFKVMLHNNTYFVISNAVFTTGSIIWKRKDGNTDSKN